MGDKKKTLEKEMEEISKQITKLFFGKPVKQYRGSTRDARQKTGRYWVYSDQTDSVIAKVCQDCRSNGELMDERFGKAAHDYYVTNRRNHDKCDICGKI